MTRLKLGGILGLRLGCSYDDVITNSTSLNTDTVFCGDEHSSVLCPSSELLTNSRSVTTLYAYLQNKQYKSEV